jgi:hypothetical protein
MMRRRWDYFVRYLAGGIPPNEYEMKPFAAVTKILSSGPSADDPSDPSTQDFEADPQP